MSSNKTNSIKTALQVYFVVFLVWTVYRFIFSFPIWIDELLVKPVLFLAPPFLFLKKGESLKKYFPLKGETFLTLKKGTLFGMVYSLVAIWFNYLKYGRINLSTFGLEGLGMLVFLGLGLVTALVEETLFRGYLLKKLLTGWQDEWLAVSVNGLMFALIHLPILVISANSAGAILVQLILTLIVGWGNGVLRLRTQSILAPVLSHLFWGTSIYLFR